MYSVSQDYMAALHGNVTRAYITFTIDNVTYTEDNILQGSFNISNQCTGTGDVTIGGVYVGVLNATLRNVSISRQSWHGKKIIPTFHCLVDEENNTWEDVPLGEYSISQAEWKATGVTVRAYDNMSLLDKEYFVESVEGELYDFLSMAASACGITLAQTKAQIEALPNGDLTYQFYYNTGVETWRDIVSCIAQVVGGFATCNRDGELEIRTFSNTACDSLDTTGRHTGGYFSDYTTKYTSFTVTYVEIKESRTYSQPEDDGLVMQIGANPFLQIEEQVQSLAQDLLDSIAHIQHTPYKISMVSNPIYDLGDAIEFTDGLAGVSSLCSVQKYEFNLHKQLKLSGFGSDPNTQDAKSKTQKQLVSLQSGVGQVSDQTLDFISPTALSQSNIVDNSSNAIETFEFTSNADKGKVDFFTCIQFEVETTVASGVYSDLLVTTTLTVDGNSVATILRTYRDGRQMYNLNYLIENVTKGNHTLTVTMAASGGSITNVQFISAYLLTAKSTNSGRVTQKVLYSNGQWAADVLMDGLDPSMMTEAAYLNGTESSMIKSLLAPQGSTTLPDIQGLSQYFGSKYLLLHGLSGAKPFYTKNGYYRKPSQSGYEKDTFFYIPIKRISGFNKVQFEAKMVETSGGWNNFVMGVSAIRNSEMPSWWSNTYSNVSNWTVYTFDISNAAYIDYIILHGITGSPAFRYIKLLKED